jgi:hypothetical protein
MARSSKHRLASIGAAAFLGAAVSGELPILVFGRSAWDSFLRPWTLVSATLFVTAFLAARCCDTPMARTSVLLFAALGVAGSVLADATYDSLVNDHDRNLFPIEVAVMTTLTLPAAAAGTAAGALLR